MSRTINTKVNTMTEMQGRWAEALSLIPNCWTIIRRRLQTWATLTKKRSTSMSVLGHLRLRWTKLRSSRKTRRERKQILRPIRKRIRRISLSSLVRRRWSQRRSNKGRSGNLSLWSPKPSSRRIIWTATRRSSSTTISRTREVRPQASLPASHSKPYQ